MTELCFFGSGYRIGPMYQDIILIKLDASFDQTRAKTNKHAFKNADTHNTSMSAYKRNRRVVRNCVMPCSCSFRKVMERTML